MASKVATLLETNEVSSETAAFVRVGEAFSCSAQTVRREWLDRRELLTDPSMRLVRARERRLASTKYLGRDPREVWLEWARAFFHFLYNNPEVVELSETHNFAARRLLVKAGLYGRRGRLRRFLTKEKA